MFYSLQNENCKLPGDSNKITFFKFLKTFYIDLLESKDVKSPFSKSGQ